MPSDTDLKQMYAYNFQFGAVESLLIYPRLRGSMDVKGQFKESHESFGGHAHQCRMHFMQLFYEDGKLLDPNAGSQVLNNLFQYEETK